MDSSTPPPPPPPPTPKTMVAGSAPSTNESSSGQQQHHQQQQQQRVKRSGSSGGSTPTGGTGLRRKARGGGGGITTGTTRSKTTKATTTGTRRMRRHHNKLKQWSHHFASYLSFGIVSTFALGLFMICYFLVLVVLMPSLLWRMDTRSGGGGGSNDGSTSLSSSSSSSSGHGHGHGDDMRLPNLHLNDTQYLKGYAKEYIEHEKGLAKDVAANLKRKVFAFKEGRGVTDESLMKDAVNEFTMLRKQRQEAGSVRRRQQQNQLQQAVQAQAQQAIVGDLGDPLHKLESNNNNNNNNNNNDDDDRRRLQQQRPGVFVLGMHRSGTSVLSGLLHRSAGYQVGGPLIGANFDNEKGFYEHLPIVLQNDEFLHDQKAVWAANVLQFNGQTAYENYKKGLIPFDVHGVKGLQFLTDPHNVPWIQKDPRMCITIRTWLSIMKDQYQQTIRQQQQQLLPNDRQLQLQLPPEPAVVFTYRHPMEVAMSLYKREENFSIERGLRLWIVYNIRAIQNSNDLCRVTSSNDAIFANPIQEIQRICDELTNRCNVVPPPKKISQEDVDVFIDPSLRHNKNTNTNTTDSEGGNNNTTTNTKKIISQQDGCIIYDYDRSHDPNTHPLDYEREERLYIIAMTLHCDLQSGKIYQPDYPWPNLP